MKSFKQFLVDFYHDEEGLTTVEYAVAGALVAAGVVAAFDYLGTEVNKSITGVGGELDTQNQANTYTATK
ncbi:Flp family type IVb pilin [Photobacterium lutimaris]|uniref:Flp family type IVb pilin n=1 Tax=Photobacterium lutimaris TaxID=388278 RepID=A0A2T3J3X8_9GAMM|nr:Flp family type IVb pilin [Photobacterium lutimaris]PSU36000.1 Flp family type IVb pilin [Photobacterium lutimaris]TDR79091.1 pilus assembly protein Flp/PilA [Photobacterium lutimaris]